MTDRVDEYKQVVKKHARFTNEQICAAANNAELEAIVLEGLGGLLKSMVYSFASKRTALLATGIMSTMDDLLIEAKLGVLLCIRAFKPRDATDIYSFYNYVYPGVSHRLMHVFNQQCITAVSWPVRKVPYCTFAQRTSFLPEGQMDDAMSSDQFCEGDLDQLVAKEDATFTIGGVSFTQEELNFYLTDVFSKVEKFLTPNEKRVMQVLHTDPFLTVAEVSKKLHVSKQYISQLITGIFAKIHKNVLDKTVAC